MDAASRPLVCICLPTYNAGLTLGLTLDSILAQTYRNLQVSIVDNASTDNTLEVAGVYAKKDGRIKIYTNTVNAGAEGNFNRCLKLAAGDYTAIYHSDDLYTPTMVEEEVAFLEGNPEAGVVFTMAVQIDEKGAESLVYKLPAEVRSGGLYDFAVIFRTMLRRGNFLFCPSAMARTPVYRDFIRQWDAGGYRSASDGEVWLRIAQRYKIGIIAKPLLKYRVSASSFSYHAARGKTGPHDMLRLFEDYLAGPAAGIAGDRERGDYELLKLLDSVNRAFNLLLSGGRGEARALLPGLFKGLVVAHALKSAGHLKTLLFGYAVYFLSFLPLNESARKLLSGLRF